MSSTSTSRLILRKSLDNASRPAGIRFALRRWQVAITGIALLGVFILAMAYVQFGTVDMPDNDGFYHIKFADVMRTEGLKPKFPWLPLSILNPRDFADHHFLFHVALIPFTFGDLRLGAKWAAVIFSAFAFLSIWWLLYHQRVPYAWVWALGLLAVSEAFLYRMSITRAQSLSLAVLAWGLHWLLIAKYKRLLPLAFVYVWLYDAFPLLLVMAGMFILANWWLERKIDLRPMAYVALGILLGLIIHPYFPHNVVFFLRHLAPKITDATAVNVGSEWYPYQTKQLLQNSPLALLAFISGVLALGLNPRRMDLRTMLAFFLVVVFGLMLFQSRRFVEYFPAFTLIFMAFAWTPLFQREDQGSHTGSRDISVSPNLLLTGSIQKSMTWKVVAGVLILVACSWYTLTETRASVEDSKPYTTYAAASRWLMDHTPAGARIFQTDWDDFPRLFFYNAQNTYLVGLDPTYMQLYNPELYDLWVRITQGKIEAPAETIYARFGASYIVTDLYHKDFIRQASADPGLKEVYQDGDAIVYEVIGEFK